jgi:hypothetical protein
MFVLFKFFFFGNEAKALPFIDIGEKSWPFYEENWPKKRYNTTPSKHTLKMLTTDPINIVQK